MNDAELERLRQKVEAGEVLTHAELSALRSAAQSDRGPTLKVAVAQALINAEASAQALPLLESLRRDFPKDTEVLLAQARALLSLERWNEAEGPLQRVLALNPTDPEALKGLAVLCLRRGEFSRATAHLDAVLQQDPFDGEAQLLRAEIDEGSQALVAPGSPSSDREPADSAAFVLALTAQLKAQSTAHLVQKRQLLVRLGQGSLARLDLEALYQSFLESGRPLAEAVESLGTELAERSLGLPKGREALLTTVLPVLRDGTFLDRAVGSARREGPAGLWVFYAIEDPELLRYVPEGALTTHQVTLEELDAAAWANLARVPAEIRPIALEQGHLRLKDQPTGLWAIASADGHDPARLVTPAQQRLLSQVAGPGPYRVYLGLRELVLVCREADAAVRSQLEGLEPTREGIGGAWRLQDGRLTALDEWASV